MRGHSIEEHHAKAGSIGNIITVQRLSSFPIIHALSGTSSDSASFHARFRRWKHVLWGLLHERGESWRTMIVSPKTMSPVIRAEP